VAIFRDAKEIVELPVEWEVVDGRTRGLEGRRYLSQQDGTSCSKEVSRGMSVSHAGVKTWHNCV